MVVSHPLGTELLAFVLLLAAVADPSWVLPSWLVGSGVLGQIHRYTQTDFTEN